MPVSGVKPKNGPVRHRVKPAFHWTDVPDVPYTGPRPELPGELEAVRGWWDALSSLPHCALWRASDWEYALDTARLLCAARAGEIRLWPECRQREKILGSTMDARRDIRVKYVEPESGAVEHRSSDRLKLVAGE